MSKVLIVCGARVLDASPAARRWAKAELAAWLGIPRVALPCFHAEIDRPVLRRPPTAPRWTKDADRFRYDPKDPKGRNAALMAWGAAQRDAGHTVQVWALYAPWTATKGTAHAVGLARNHDLPVVERVASPDLMPDTHDCTGGEG